MNSATIAGALVTLVLLGLAGNHAALEAEEASQGSQGFLYGRVVGVDGATYEGRLRFGGDEEAFWGHYFNAAKDGNPWSAHVPPELLGRKLKIFGLEIAEWGRKIDLARPFMVRFGDIARIDAPGRELRVTLKSGAVIDLARFGADDFADGVRVWDDESGAVVDLEEWGIRSIEFLPTPRLDVVPERLHGTVRTDHGEFTGFVQWNRKASLRSDELTSVTDGRGPSFRFAEIRAIDRGSRDGFQVTLQDGREVVLADTPETGNAVGGIYVDDARYGRVLVSWDAFRRLDFGSASGSPTYADFPSGRPLTGTVTTRDGQRLQGRMVFDLDES